MRLVAGMKAIICDCAGVVDGIPFLLYVHVSVSVGEMEKGSSSPNRELRGNVEAEKPHSWFTIAGHVGSYVDFREVGDWIESRAVSKSDAAHVERDNGDPCFAFVEVDI